MKAKKQGRPSRKRQRRGFGGLTVKAVKPLLKKLTVIEIAKRFKVSRQAVNQFCLRHNIERGTHVS